MPSQPVWGAWGEAAYCGRLKEHGGPLSLLHDLDLKHGDKPPSAWVSIPTHSSPYRLPPVPRGELYRVLVYLGSYGSTVKSFHSAGCVIHTTTTDVSNTLSWPIFLQSGPKNQAHKLVWKHPVLYLRIYHCGLLCLIGHVWHNASLLTKSEEYSVYCIITNT